MNLAELRRYEHLLKYEAAALDAEERLLSFAKFTMPTEKHPHDPERSLYMPARHHEIMADLMESVDRGEIRKAIILTAVRHGKSEICTRRMMPWFQARRPEREVMLGTYTEKFAQTFRREIAAIIRSKRFKQVFPDYVLEREGTDYLTNHMGKNMWFLGRRSTTTGRGADLLLLDDPMRDAYEASHAAYRDEVWEWITQTLWSRRHTDKAPFVLTTSRWHEDDPAGRLTDKTNPKYAREFAEGIEVVHMPALAEEDDILGRKPGEALWPQRFSSQDLEATRALNPVAFTAIYQCDPAPAEGIHFLKDDLHTYDRTTWAHVKDTLRIYGASDHAVSTAQMNDRTCMGLYGVAPDGVAYVHPDLVWQRIGSTTVVDEWLRLIRSHKPLWWYAERGQLSRSLGPFVKIRMQEEGVWCPIVEDHPVGDKVQRSQSARARCAQRRILFPDFASWWPSAKLELLKFPNAKHDDFVDFLSIIGLKLQSAAPGSHKAKTNSPEPGTWGALKAHWAAEDAQDRARKARAGW